MAFAHASGDAINAVLAAAGYNFRRLLAWLRLLLLRILIAFSLPAQLHASFCRAVASFFCLTRPASILPS